MSKDDPIFKKKNVKTKKTYKMAKSKWSDFEKNFLA